MYNFLKVLAMLPLFMTGKFQSYTKNYYKYSNRDPHANLILNLSGLIENGFLNPMHSWNEFKNLSILVSFGAIAH